MQPRENHVEKRELVILGAGPAGLTAAIYGKRAGLDVLIIERGAGGGQITITDEIENWPGTPRISGLDLAQAFRAHAAHFKAEFRQAEIVSLDLEHGRKIVDTDQGQVQAGALVIATGASFCKMGCPGEAEFAGRGVSYCAVCDAAFFEDQIVAVVGGGNTAVEEALYLTRFASKVYLVHRRDSFRAHRTAVERCLANPKIEPVLDSVVEAIRGQDTVESVSLRNVRTGLVCELAVSGVFLFVGTAPNTCWRIDTVAATPEGWIITDERMETSVPGVFAAGDVRQTSLRQVVTAAGDGARAAMSAYHYLTAKP